MSHFSIDAIYDRIRDIQDLIYHLEGELEIAGITGQFDEADAIKCELIDAERELLELEGSIH